MKYFKSVLAFLVLSFLFTLNSCADKAKNSSDKDINKPVYPSDVIPFMDQWKILLGDGTRSDTLDKFEKKDFFYVANDGKRIG